MQEAEINYIMQLPLNATRLPLGLRLLYKGCAERGFIYSEHKPFDRPCLGVTHSFISFDAMRSHLPPLFASLEKGYLCIFCGG
jgi:hypothetical protein